MKNWEPMAIVNKTAIRNITILLGSTLTVLAGVILAPALPDMAVAFQDIPNADFLVMLTLTMPALFVVIGAPFAGLLLDRWGRKPVLLFSLILYGLAGTSGFVLDSLTGILIGRAFLGLAVAGVMTGFTTLIADYFTGSRLNRFMGYQGAAMGLGAMVFLLIGGYLADIGWHFPFLIHLLAFFIIPGVLFAIDEPKIKADVVRQSKKLSFPFKVFAPIYAAAFAGMFIFFVFPVQLPFYLSAEAGATNSQVGLALAFQSITAIIIALNYQRLKRRLSFQGILGIVFLALAINHIIIAFTPAYGLVVVGLLIGGLGLGVLPPTLNVWIASVASPAMRGRAVGGLTAFLFLGQFFTPIITQPIVGQLGMAGTFGVVGGVSLLMAVAFVGYTIIHKKKGSAAFFV